MTSIDMIVMKDRIKELNEILGTYRDAYYNHNESLISDKDYDKLYDELLALEKETGVVYSNSPTQEVGYPVVSELKKVTHSHPMLSLDKTKSVDDLVAFTNKGDAILSLKMDGLTVLLTYEDGELVQAETRGNGEIGEDITHNISAFENVPLKIPFKERFEIEGEAIITYDDFDKINADLPEDKKYKNPRNLASGSVRQLNCSIAAERHLKFVAWKVPNYKKEWVSYTHENLPSRFIDSLYFAKELGFTIVPLFSISLYEDNKEEAVKMVIDYLKDTAANLSYPIDGLVITYDDIEYGQSLGRTGHHPNHSLAFKFYNEEYETTLRNIEWTMGKSGTLTPTAVFDEVDIDGTTVSRASVHNVSVLTSLDLQIGDTITVYKANEIIPQVKENLTSKKAKDWERGYIVLPSTCPVCHGNVIIEQENDSKVLKCINDDCPGKLLGRLCHYVSRDAMNIKGLSEETLEKFISLGWIKSSELDIYQLKDHYVELINLDGFGRKSADNILKAIEMSKDTTLDRFINALSIPLVGKETAKIISKHFKGSFDEFYNALQTYKYPWNKIDGIGDTTRLSIMDYGYTYGTRILALSKLLHFETDDVTNNPEDMILNGKTFVITGSLNIYKNRNELVADIEKYGGKVAGSVSKNTSYLINNDTESNSSKNQKAKSLNVPIISEEDFLKMIGAQ